MGLARTTAEREVVTLPPEATVADAARLMARRHAGAIVIEESGVPKGILTDRDIAIRVVAAGLDPAATKVAQVMSKNLVTASDRATPLDLALLMAEHGVRRVPLVGPDARLVGLTALDDLLAIQGHSLACLARAIAAEQRHEAKTLDPEG